MRSFVCDANNQPIYSETAEKLVVPRAVVTKIKAEQPVRFHGTRSVVQRNIQYMFHPTMERNIKKQALQNQNPLQSRI